MGEITRAVYEMQLDGRVQTLAEATKAAERMLTTIGRSGTLESLKE